MHERQYKSDWSHLHLSGWPFQTVPDETFMRIWADQAKVKEQVDRLIWRWSRIDRSTFHLMWADLGAGKTHTLRHIQMRCLDRPELGILPVYAVMPKYIRSFVEVYQAIVAGLDLDVIAEMFLSVYRHVGGKKTIVREIFPSIPDAVPALLALRSDMETERTLAAQWFLAARGLIRRQLDSIGVTRRLQTSDDAVAILSGFIRLVQFAGTYRRVLVMLDECQRLGNFKLSIGRDVNTGLQTWYDASPNHLTTVMSFGSGEERYVRHLLSPELQNREDHQRLSLELLSEEEALRFVCDLLASFRTEGCPSDLFPFTTDIVVAVVRRLVRESGVTPRFLMKAFDCLLTEADFMLSTGGDFQLDAKTAVELVEAALAELGADQQQ